jgi:hypothetical protein
MPTNLCLSRATQKRAALEDAINFEAAVLVDGRGGDLEPAGLVRGKLGRAVAGDIARPLDLDLGHDTDAMQMPVNPVVVA